MTSDVINVYRNFFLKKILYINSLIIILRKVVNKTNIHNYTHRGQNRLIPAIKLGKRTSLIAFHRSQKINFINSITESCYIVLPIMHTKF